MNHYFPGIVVKGWKRKTNPLLGGLGYIQDMEKNTKQINLYQFCHCKSKMTSNQPRDAPTKWRICSPQLTPHEHIKTCLKVQLSQSMESTASQYLIILGGKCVADTADTGIVHCRSIPLGRMLGSSQIQDVRAGWSRPCMRGGRCLRQLWHLWHLNPRRVQELGWWELWKSGLWTVKLGWSKGWY